MQSKQTLNDFPKISLNLKNSALSAVKALHVVAYGDKGLPRQTRKNLRNFTNFAWDKESQEYSTKLDDIKNKLSMPDLVAVCSVLDLNYTGSEDDVIERICSFLNDFNLEDENDDEDEDASDDDGDKDVYHKENGKDVTEDDRYNEDNDANSDKDAYHEEEGKDVTDDDNNDDDMDDERTTDLFTRNRSKSNKMTRGRLNDSFALTFRDVEDSIRNFDGKDDYPIGKWITDFEEISNLMGWNDLQMLIFAKRSLKGIAKLYIQSEKGVNS
ncbi:acidic leucine-rich nuclear phosphoprotein 32 family member A-like [Diabrotica virgifera virgifera]|uniref:Protein PFC0760c-like n=1 Tax=Diabrotica virgifera virgifera TaxID=50390 RepID=A0ABM5K058_DIAVI|nr:acidic leucine-rich nuclear phosphoprotein 32 family member A-like [Diabrotica virgifera virgifera]